SALLLGAVAAAGLAPAADAAGVEGAPHDLVADAGQILHSATAYEHDRVLLEVVADTGDVGRDLGARRQTDPRDLAQRRVRLCGCVREHARAHAPALGRALERGGLAGSRLAPAALANELLDRGHVRLPRDDAALAEPGNSTRRPLRLRSARARLRRRTACRAP